MGIPIPGKIDTLCVEKGLKTILDSILFCVEQ